MGNQIQLLLDGGAHGGLHQVRVNLEVAVHQHNSEASRHQPPPRLDCYVIPGRKIRAHFLNITQRSLSDFSFRLDLIIVITDQRKKFKVRGKKDQGQRKIVTLTVQ